MNDVSDERSSSDTSKIFTESPTKRNKVIEYVLTAILTVFFVVLFMSFLWPLLKWLEAR